VEGKVAGEAVADGDGSRYLWHPSQMAGAYSATSGLQTILHRTFSLLIFSLKNASGYLVRLKGGKDGSQVVRRRTILQHS